MQTQLQRMVAGLPFNSNAEELQALHLANLHRLWELNRCDPADVDLRTTLLYKAVPNAGENFYAQSPFHCDYGINIYTGKDVYINFNCVILDVGRVTIGDKVMIGPNVAIYAVSHPIHPEPRAASLDYGHDVFVGNNVWVGGNCVLNPGIRIGDNSVIGSGSVITKDVPENVVAAGNPCRVLRAISEDDRYFFRKGKPFDPECIYQPMSAE